MATLSWKRAPGLAAAVVALSLGAAACGSDTADDAAGSSDGDSTESAAPSGGPVLDASVLSGEATTVDGSSFDLGPLANQDLVVWFWAPW